MAIRKMQWNETRLKDIQRIGMIVNDMINTPVIGQSDAQLNDIFTVYTIRNVVQKGKSDNFVATRYI